MAWSTSDGNKPYCMPVKMRSNLEGRRHNVDRTPMGLSSKRDSKFGRKTLWNHYSPAPTHVLPLMSIDIKQTRDGATQHTTDPASREYPVKPLMNSVAMFGGPVLPLMDINVKCLPNAATASSVPLNEWAKTVTPTASTDTSPQLAAVNNTRTPLNHRAKTAVSPPHLPPPTRTPNPVPPLMNIKVKMSNDSWTPPIPTKPLLPPRIRKPNPNQIILPNGKMIFKRDGLYRFLRSYDYQTVHVKDKFLILGDSIIKRVENINNTLIIAYPGFTFSKLLTLIEYGMIKEICDKSTIIIHIGTNDISVTTPEDLVERALTLTRAIHRFNDGCKIALSHIIPRPIDFEETNEKIYKYHNLLYKYSMEPRGMGSFCTIPTNNTFMSYSKPVLGLYNQDDLLHPNPLGDSRLRQFLSNHLAKLRISSNKKRTSRKTSPTIIRRRLNPQNSPAPPPF